MCGIAGQVRSDGASVDAALMGRMCVALEHRGPDSRGIHLDGGVGLGIQRLRVIDLHTGDQPIYNETRDIVVVLNGEIYNFRELRRRLEQRGHHFETQGDTEVIAHLYEDEGPACVRALHGMFAFALWDTRRQRLLLARDRVGKKPLFYALRPGAISFASELNALMADGELRRDLDHAALDAYFAYRYVPAPLTAFQAARKLPPASTLVLENGSASIERYWRLNYAPKRKLNEDELREEVREHIRRAVRRRMVADVPLGAFLSGGIDSSAVVAAMAEASTEPVRTFSIGFSSKRFDELPRARLVAQRFGTRHEELVVEPDALDIVPQVLRSYGEPFGDASAVASFYVAKLARSEVTVALNGDGGDESFGGYPRYVSNALLERSRRLAGPAQRAVPPLGRLLRRGERVDGWSDRARRAALTFADAPADRYHAYVTHLNGVDRDRLYQDGYRELVDESWVPEMIGELWRDSTATAPVDVMLDVDVRSYLPGDLLVKMDIATMAHSLEARSPLLDHEFMEFAASLPVSAKVRGREKKVGLRRALRGWIPDEVLDGPKRGFELPLREWFRDQLRDYVRGMLLAEDAAGREYFRAPYVRSLVERHIAGIEDNSKALWTLLAFEVWHRQCVNRSMS